MGKSPFVCIWDLASGSLLTKLGQKFFARLVVCVAFSEDGSMVAAISGDDHHMMGVWNIATGKLIAEAGANNGSPPQVYGLQWLPFEENQLVTLGCSHVKLWSLKSGQGEGRGRSNPPQSQLYFRAATFGKGKQARVMTCVDIIKKHEAIVTGGNNGFVYIWKRDKLHPRGEAPAYCCVASFFAHRDGVYSLCGLNEGSGFHVLTGGGDGALKQWDLSKAKGITVDPDPSALLGIISVGHPTPDASSSSSSSTTTATNTIKPTAERPSKSPYPKESSLKSVTTEVWQENVTKVAIRDMCRLEFDFLVVGLTSGRIITVDLTTKLQQDLVRCHHGLTQGLAVHPTNTNLFATTSEDGQLIIMEAEAKTNIQAFVLTARGRSVAWSPDGRHVAVGYLAGAVGVYELPSMPNSKRNTTTTTGLGRGVSGPVTLKEVKTVRHCKEAIDDMKFSPDGRYLAAASHDNFIDLYDSRAGYEHARRLKGHNSYLTHIDWSKDSQVIQSNCGAYEIIYWDVKTGKMMRSTKDTVEANTDWSTWTCVLGFPVMGIWQKDSDGTDVNSVDRSLDGRLLVTGDDYGKVKLFNYPVVVEHGELLLAVVVVVVVVGRVVPKAGQMTLLVVRAKQHKTARVKSSKVDLLHYLTISHHVTPAPALYIQHLQKKPAVTHLM